MNKKEFAMYLAFMGLLVIGLIMLYNYGYELSHSPCSLCMNQTGVSCFRIDPALVK